MLPKLFSKINKSRSKERLFSRSRRQFWDLRVNESILDNFEPKMKILNTHNVKRLRSQKDVKLENFEKISAKRYERFS